ncbi:MMPL family transporter [Glutamicibacter sp.]|uniref:MMPL family transporter n=1 Tax=Glutamicibacter sp. TaxID=1931995 RepID=UPI0028BF363B|nr:MMPL family transporter [Glutamicibacter sp.]
MNHPVLTRLSRSLTSKRGARVWALGITVVVVLLFGALSSVQAPQRSGSSLVSGSESAEVAQVIQANSSDNSTTALLVATGANGQKISPDQTQQLTGQVRSMADQLNLTVGRPLASDDAQALMVPVSWTTVSDDADRQTLIDIRSWISEHPVDAVDQQVTGSTAFAVDITQAFAGADFTLLAVTILIVAVLLIVTYRSPVLWLLPLAVVGLADGTASKVANLLGNWLGLHFDSGVLSVLVFGAGTNYALLLISRYREELRKHADHRSALSRAWVSSFEAILTSNLTVVFALLTLGLAMMEDTRGLGIVCAVGLLIAAVFVLFLLPPVLAMAGRKAFWPLIPRPGQVETKANIFARMANAAMRKPAINLATLMLLLVVLASSLAGVRLGLDQTQQFRTATESASAMEQLVEHFPAGEAQPIIVLSDSDDTSDLRNQISALPDVARVSSPSALEGTRWQQFSVITSADPGSQQAQDLVKNIREVAAQEGDGTVLVGGQIAERYDTEQGHLRDLLVIAPLIMLICFIALGWLTRSFRTALALGLVNLLSAAAAIGIGSLVSSLVFSADALDVQVPLLAFVFLVALGVDYTIFFTQRVQQNLASMPLKPAIAQAAGHTGSVITSAGLVLAGVFAALAALPLMVLGQLGVIVGLGVLLDTFVVRTLLLPALFATLGRNGRPIFGSHTAGTEITTHHKDQKDTIVNA